jgi:hypothetical protein
MARFTTANARQMAARSVAARKEAKAKRNANRAQPEHLTRYYAAPYEKAADTGLGIDVVCVREKLEKLDALMGKAKTDREWIT